MWVFRSLLLGGVAAMVPVASAQITFVDATLGNTTNASGTPFAPTADAVRANNDNLWTVRNTSGNFGLAADGSATGELYESNGTNGTGITGSNSGEDAPMLKTTIAGLTPGASYRIYTYFYDVANSGTTEWGLLSGLSPTSLTSFSGATDATSPPISGPVTAAPAAVADGTPGNLPSGYSVTANNRLYQASLGTAVADTSGNVVVYVDDFPNPPFSGGNERARYDGVGFEAVPEPGGLAGLAVGGVALIRRRRRA